MFAIFKRIGFAFAAGCFFSICSTSVVAHQQYVDTDKSCDGDDCSVTLATEPYEKLCDSQHIFAFWNRRRPDYVMLQCPCDCTTESNTNWLVNGRSGDIYAFSAGRFVLNSFIADASADTEVPDRFGNTKFCGAPRKDKLAQSKFVLLFKRPYKDSSPYCYEIGYIILKNGRFFIAGDNGKIPSNNRNYWLKSVSNSDKNFLLSIWRMVTRNN